MPEKPTYEELEQRIKELEAAEAELQESRDKYQALFEAANDAIFVTSAETGIIMDANEMAERLIGRSSSQKPIFEFGHLSLFALHFANSRSGILPL